MPPGRRFRPGWKRGILLGLGAVVVLLVFWLYLGYRSFSNEIAKANARLDPKTEKALTPAGNILRSPQVTLVLGSDSRGAGSTARADSIVLMRTDPGKHLSACCRSRATSTSPSPATAAPRSTPPTPTAGRRS